MTTTHAELVADRRRALEALRDEYERKPISQYRAAVLAAVEAAWDVIADCDQTLAASEETWQRAYDRQQANLTRARAHSALVELRAVPDDDDTLVRVTFQQPPCGWKVGHLQDAYVRLREAGADDWQPLDATGRAASEGGDGLRWSAVVTNPNAISLVMPDQTDPSKPAPLRFDNAEFDEPEPGMLRRFLDRHPAPPPAFAALVAVLASLASVAILTALGVRP